MFFVTYPPKYSIGNYDFQSRHVRSSNAVHSRRKCGRNTTIIVEVHQRVLNDNACFSINHSVLSEIHDLFRPFGHSAFHTICWLWINVAFSWKKWHLLKYPLNSLHLCRLKKLKTCLKTRYFWAVCNPSIFAPLFRNRQCCDYGMDWATTMAGKIYIYCRHRIWGTWDCYFYFPRIWRVTRRYNEMHQCNGRKMNIWARK